MMPSADQIQVETWECERSSQGPQGSAWKQNRSDLHSLCTLPRAERRCMIVFLDTPEEGPSSPQSVQSLLSQTFGIPHTFWSPLCQLANGYFRSRQIHEANEDATCTTFRFLCKQHDKSKSRPDKVAYTWDTLAFATRWSSQKDSIMLCFDLEPVLRKRIHTAMEAVSYQSATSSPYALHTIALEAVTQVFDKSVWAWRDVVRAFEMDRRDPNLPKADYIGMHEVGRHTTHCTESLLTALNVLGEIIGANDRYSKTAGDAIHSDLAYHRSVLDFLHLRSKALETRLMNEINLVFHVVAEKDSVSAVQVARASQRESMTMKTIAVLGLVFLPGTLISAIFSTSFFDYASPGEDGTWSVSSQFWIYWAVTLPITILTLAVWFLWQWHQSRANREEY